ncbi:receptor-type adenylate cyclase [Trypanosoma cruzi]|nr:receptor-type adenylate cyclase [Trypanosoma cruzi]
MDPMQPVLAAVTADIRTVIFQCMQTDLDVPAVVWPVGDETPLDAWPLLRRQRLLALSPCTGSAKARYWESHLYFFFARNSFLDCTLTLRTLLHNCVCTVLTTCIGRMFPACTGACCCFWLDERNGLRAVWGFQATQYGGFFAAAYLQSFFFVFALPDVDIICLGGCLFLCRRLATLPFPFADSGIPCAASAQYMFWCGLNPLRMPHLPFFFYSFFFFLKFWGPTVYGATDGTVLRGLFLSADGSDFVFFFLLPFVCVWLHFLFG